MINDKPFKINDANSVSIYRVNNIGKSHQILPSKDFIQSYLFNFIMSLLHSLLPCRRLNFNAECQLSLLIARKSPGH